jgi:dTDP-L-rhamnose 4-epimerase
VSERVLVTGGAGFIGSHLVDALHARGDEVKVLDVLHPQVHGPGAGRPAYLDPAARLVVGDVRDRDALGPLLDQADVVVHLAAYTGVGQSMYQVRDYLDVNVVGTGVLLELLGDNRRRVRKLVLASSRAVYGEGAYRCARCGVVTPPPRRAEDLLAGRWEPVCPVDGSPLTALPTPETSPVVPASIYAVSKSGQEHTALVVGAARGLPVVALRCFNVFGSRQALSNPYTGVIPAFVRRVLTEQGPEVYEDGNESRDFVHVRDVVRAMLLAIDRADADGLAVNVGSGTPQSLLDVASAVSSALDGPPPEISGKFRVGDIRHSHADLTRAREVLGFEPSVDVGAGLRELVGEITEQLHEDLSPQAETELSSRGLVARAE